MKRKTAKEILAESFRELAERQGIDKITIREITDNCGYSPATFYRHFRDKYDLVAWDYSRNLSEFIGSSGYGECEWKQMLLDAAMFFQEHKTYLANLFEHTSGRDAFINYMVEIHAEYLQNVIKDAAGMTALDKKTEMYIRVYCHGAIALSCEWILGIYKVTPEEMAEIFENSLPQPLHPYLCQNETI